ncbi:S1 family peptidase [Hymenobacter defluvii]|uniref:Serine protease n=1 Tax=Hymenobacter defluvii TaxID=2054411 RepID=A0ABS3THK9_9BACT|nr:serine protease [Hymenobacter defluvii]MBO3273159.1 trypsin-like peptidase domain-containing protein [Hymenobacter defluvii]
MYTSVWTSIAFYLRGGPAGEKASIAHDAPQRIYIIGHPDGGTLSLSLQDNLLLDYQEPLIHYRTPTVGGSSGSPVFNQQWQLIGIMSLHGPA